MTKFPVGSRVKISEEGHARWGTSACNPECSGTVERCGKTWTHVLFDNGANNAYSKECQLELVNNEPPTPVLFRADRRVNFEVTAVFPTLEYPMHPRGIGYTCYTHVGQHSACCRDWYHTTRPATPAEYTPLLKELEAMGYNLRIITRWSPKKG